MAAAIVFSKRSPLFGRAVVPPASKDLTLRRRLEGFMSISEGKVGADLYIGGRPNVACEFPFRRCSNSCFSLLSSTSLASVLAISSPREKYLSSDHELFVGSSY